jgi:hypothetical protein
MARALAGAATTRRRPYVAFSRPARRIPQLEPSQLRGHRTETYKYLEYDNGETKLYDLEADPCELESIP